MTMFVDARRRCAMPSIKKQITDRNVMQNEKVQKWVNSLLVHDGNDVHEHILSEDGHLRSDKDRDNMTLGAEAKSVHLKNGETEEILDEIDDENEDDNVESITNGEVQPEKMLYGNMYSGSSPALQLLRQRFRLQQQDSFNSETSSHMTIESIDQLLFERRRNPEKILENLGFVGKTVDKWQRIPERFLKTTSKARGICVEKFLDDHPWLKDYLEQRDAMRRPITHPLFSQNAESSEEGTDVERDVETTADTKMTDFHQVASTVSMMNRFRGLVRHIHAKEPEPEPLIEPVLRNSIRGMKYWSILVPDNCNFLDQMGYYEYQLDKLSKLKDNTDKFRLAAHLTKQISSGAILKPIIKEPVAVNGQAEPEPFAQPSEKLDKILCPRMSISVVEKPNEIPVKEKMADKLDVPFSVDRRFSVPQRFLTSQSTLFGEVQQMTGESVSELVRQNSNFNMEEISELCAAIPAEKTFEDVIESPEEDDLPVIKINSTRFSGSSLANTVESFEYEWQRTSVSSTATEDSMYSDTDDNLTCFRDSFDQTPLDFFGLTVDDVGRRFLRVPSDAGSNLSSHTLQDPENADRSSDPDTCTDTLQASQDLASLRLEDGVQGNDQTDNINNENDISNDRLPPVLNFSSKLKGVLRRQGSSQSDSSGFVDTDHLDAGSTPDPFSKTRYINRQMKLDTISSQDSTSIEDESSYSSQSDLCQSGPNGESIHRLRILKGDFRKEFWYTKHSVATQTDSISPDDQSARSMKQKFLSQPEIFTTRLYINSLLPKTSVPLMEKTEVMLILDEQRLPTRCEADGDDSSLQSVRHISSVDVEVMKTKSGKQRLTPVLFSAGKTATVKSERHGIGAVAESDLVEHDNIDSVIESPRCKHVVRSSVGRSKSFQMDVSHHQILHSLLKQSVFVSPQAAALMLPPSHWSVFGHSECSQKQYLIEEVKLLQHAIQKYRLEMRVLQLQAKNLYAAENDELLPEERSSLLAMEQLQSAIAKELEHLDTQLSQRMKLVISISPDDLSFGTDFSCLTVVQQMIELLKEQLHHGNVLYAMSTSFMSKRQVFPDSVLGIGSSHDSALLEKVVLLEKKIEEQNKSFEKLLGSAVLQLHEMMQNQTQDQTKKRSIDFDSTVLK